MRIYKLFVVALMALLGSSLGFLPVKGPSRAEAVEDVPVQTYNLCQDRCHRNLNDDHYRPESPHLAVQYSVNTTTPTLWMSALTETCLIFTTYLAFNIGGLQAHFFASGSGLTAPCDASEYGVSLITVGPTITPLDPPDAPSGAFQCLLKAGWGFNWVACVVHLPGHGSNPFSGSNTHAGALIVRSYWNSIGPNMIIGGDFNATPTDLNQVFPSTWDIDHNDLARTFSLFNTTDYVRESKLDYVFGNRSWLSGAGTWGSIDCMPEFSDHCYLYGENKRP